MNKRNISIMGHPDAGASELFEAIAKLDETPKPYAVGWWKENVVIWEEEVKPPYNAKKRKKPLVE